MALDLDALRASFPALASGVAYFENAGRSFVAQSVLDRMNAFLAKHPVQPDYAHRLAQESRADVTAGIEAAAWLAGTRPENTILSHSTTINVFVLAHAIAPTLKPGDVVVVTNQDHEANTGAWRRMGAELREWKVDPETGDLRVEDLDALLDEKVRLVCFPHVSNVVGSINDVAAITKRAHAVGARVCVDGVAYAPHRRVQVEAWDVDYYLFSLYKVYGPHLGLLYAKTKHIEDAVNQSHFFHVGKTKLNPGGQQYEAVASVAGIRDYLEPLGSEIFDAIAAHEEAISRPLIEYLAEHPRVRLIGRPTADRTQRVPTISFVPQKIAPAQLIEAVGGGRGDGRGPFLCGALRRGDGHRPATRSRSREHGPLQHGRRSPATDDGPGRRALESRG